jgi:putative membrane protein
MKENIMLILKGFALGIANVIPGVSGGTIAVILGIYEKLIDILSNLKTKLKENFKYLLFLAIGLILAIGLFSNAVTFCLKNYPFATILFFIGFIIGGMPPLLNKVKSKIDIKSVICFIIAFTVVMLMAFITPDTMNKSLDIINIKTLIILFLIGVLGAASMVLPGISGSFVLMLIGYYEPIMNSISEFTKLNNLTHNILILAMFGLGVLFGIIFMAKLIKILLEKYEIPMYMGIIGFVIASAISILVSVIGSSYGVLQIIIGVILMFVGIIASRMISKGEK